MALSDITPIKRSEEYLQRIADAIEGSGGSDLPAVTSADNGDVLTVVNGAWDKAEPASQLPAVTSENNGNVLTVVDGAWDKAAPAGGYITPVMSATVTNAIASGINAVITDILQNSKTNLVIKTENLTSYADLESDYEILNDAATKYKDGVNVIIPVSATQYSAVVNGGVDVSSSIQFIVPVYGVDIPNVGQKRFHLTVLISGSVTGIFVGVAAQIMEVLI